MEEGFSRPSIQLLPFAFLLLPLSGLRLGRLWERNKHSNNPQSEFLRPPPQIDFFLPHSYLMVYQRNTQKRSYLLWLCFSVVTISLPDGRRLFSPMNPTFAFCLLTFAFKRSAPRSSLGAKQTFEQSAKRIPSSAFSNRLLPSAFLLLSLTDGRRLFSPMNPTFAFCLLTFAFREGRLPAPSLRGAPRSLYLMTSLAKVIVVQIPTCRWQ